MLKIVLRIVRFIRAAGKNSKNEKNLFVIILTQSGGKILPVKEMGAKNAASF
jgi:hypothetical protein